MLVKCTFVAKVNFTHRKPDDGLVGFDELAVPPDLDCSLTGCQVKWTKMVMYSGGVREYQT